MEKEQIKDAHVGIRINPQVGIGAMKVHIFYLLILKEFSTGGQISKFGIGYEDFKTQILDAYSKYPWLEGRLLNTNVLINKESMCTWVLKVVQSNLCFPEFVELSTL